MYTLPACKTKKTFSRIALLTSGGDAPGMNAAIRAVTRAALSYSIEVEGVYRGYSGLIDNDIQPLRHHSVDNIIQRGGTILRSDRCLEFKQAAVRQQAYEIAKARGIEALVVIGGDGSLTGAHLLNQETGLPVIGIPGTIDNDINQTSDTIGFDTAINTALNAIDSIRDTADSHSRVFIVEVMGRDSGQIASEVGIAGGADWVVLPEQEINPVLAQDIFAQYSAKLTCSKSDHSKASDSQPGHSKPSYSKQGHQAQQIKKSQIIVVAEGSQPGRTQVLAEHLRALGQDPKVCILGHIQRGGSPTGHDRVLASSMGAAAVQYLLGGYSNHMVAVQHGQLQVVAIEEVLSPAQPSACDSLWDLLR